MTTRKYAPRLLGAAFLIVAFTSVGSGLLLMSAVGSLTVWLLVAGVNAARWTERARNSSTSLAPVTSS